MLLEVVLSRWGGTGNDGVIQGELTHTNYSKFVQSFF